jgi:hypothetical protein
MRNSKIKCYFKEIERGDFQPIPINWNVECWNPDIDEWVHVSDLKRGNFCKFDECLGFYCYVEDENGAPETLEDLNKLINNIFITKRNMYLVYYYDPWNVCILASDINYFENNYE